jgi:hypothetical protein
MAVWFLANQEVFRSVGNLFGMPSKGTAHYCIMEILHILADNMRSDYIRWPNKQQQYLIAEDFSQRYGFPNVVGCIDGTHVPVKAPSNDRENYVNRKGFPSVNVMAVCDNKMRFTDVFADRAGSVHDARVLRVSPLGAQLECVKFQKKKKKLNIGTMQRIWRHVNSEKRFSVSQSSFL